MELIKFSFVLIESTVNNHVFFVLSFHRGENGELRVGVRRLMRQLNNMPSSVISSHSMHLGVLATASHAIATGTLFSVFYKPRLSLCLISHTHVFNMSFVVCFWHSCVLIWCQIS